MTLIVTDLENGRLVMGADSAIGAADEVYTRPRAQKIYRTGPYLVGVCGSMRVSQIMQVMDWPSPPGNGDDMDRFMLATIAPAIRQAVADAGALAVGRAILGDKTVISIAVRGQIFAFGHDLAMVRSDGPSCIGSGRHAAYAVMHALKAAGVEPARRRIEMTLEAVSEHHLYVRPPFHFLESE